MASARYLESFALETFLHFQRILYSSKSWSPVLRRCLRRTEADGGEARSWKGELASIETPGGRRSGLSSPFLPPTPGACSAGTLATRRGRAGIKLPVPSFGWHKCHTRDALQPPGRASSPGRRRSLPDTEKSLPGSGLQLPRYKSQNSKLRFLFGTYKTPAVYVVHRLRADSIYQVETSSPGGRNSVAETARSSLASSIVVAPIPTSNTRRTS